MIESYYSCGESFHEFYISAWEINSFNVTSIIQYFTLSTLPIENPLNGFSEDFEGAIKSSIDNAFTDSQIKGIRVIQTYLHNLFISSKNYELTAFLAHTGLYANYDLRTDILFYPSVASKLIGSNMALNPNFVDNSLNLKRVYNVNFNNWNQQTGAVNLTFNSIGTLEKNVIMWNKVLEDRDEFLKKIEIDFPDLI